MKKKFLQSTLVTVLLTALLFSALICVVLFNFFGTQTEKELSGNLMQISLAMNREDNPVEYLSALSEAGFPERLTWIAQDGSVLYDSEMSPAGMENHLSREEIVQAAQSGSGHSFRYSDTHREKTYYYAARLADGSYLRLSDTRNSALGMLMHLIWWFLAALALALLAAVLFSTGMVRRLVEPINRIQLNQPEKGAVYPELRPLIERLSQQNRSIQEYIHELNARQIQFDAITAHMSEGLVMLDAQGRIVFLNRSAAPFFNTTTGLAGHQALDLIDAENFRQAVATALHGHSAEAMLENHGSFHQLLANPVLDDGHFTGAVLLMLDVTDRRLAEQNRRDFTANVSHELKTPLTAIIGYSELLENGLAAPEDTRALAGQIHHEGTRLLSLVQDTLHLSQLDSGYGLGSREEVALQPLCREILERFQPIAAERKVTLSFEGEPVHVHGIRRLLDEIIANLLDNAIKYNVPGGQVDLRLKNDQGHAVLTVADTGIGIPERSQPRVFERFYRVDKSRSKATGGTGLGLSIVKHAVQLHGGTIQLVSHENEGTTITVTFPA